MSISRQSKKRRKTQQKRRKRASGRAADKPINWRLVLKKSKEKENKDDAARAVALIKELHYIVLVKHGDDKPRKRLS